MKKSELFFASMVGSIAIVIIIIAWFVTANDDYRVIKGYYSVENHNSCHAYRDYFDYFKYYYTPNDDQKFINSDIYNKVESKDIEEIKRYFENFEEIMDSVEKNDIYDFNEAIIDENDYFTLFDQCSMDGNLKLSKFSHYELFYYDVSSHILYVIQVSS